MTAEPKFDFELVKRKFTDKSWLSMPVYLQIGYAEEVDAFCLLDQRGLIYSHEEFKELVNEIEKFYQVATLQDINDTNENTLSQHNNGSHRDMEVKKQTNPKSVYLIRKSNGDCKIGVTSNLKSRLSQIRTVEPNAKLLHSFYADDAYKAEGILHQTYQSKNVGGEWFDLSTSDIEDIKFIYGYKGSKFTTR